MLPFHEIAILSFTALITMVNPLAVVPQFIAMTGGVSRRERGRIALTAGLSAMTVLAVFLVAGNYLFKFFGITVPAFQIMGGIIFFVNALRTLMEDERRLRTVSRPREQEPDIDPHLRAADPDVDAAAIAVVPLGVPMLAGPGSISATMVLVNLYPRATQKLALLTAILAVGLTCYLVLLASHALARFVGERGRVVFSKIMALLLGAIGIQFVINGIRPLMIEIIRAGQ